MSRNDIEADITLDEGELAPGRTARLRFRTMVREPVKIRGAHVQFIGYVETHGTGTATPEKMRFRSGS